MLSFGVAFIERMRGALWALVKLAMAHSSARTVVSAAMASFDISANRPWRRRCHGGVTYYGGIGRFMARLSAVKHHISK